MIEMLIDYIAARGFTVQVYPNVLVCYKYVGGLQFGFDWSITREDLNQTSPERLLDIADQCINSANIAMGESSV